MKVNHNYYVIQGVTDVDKMRDEAYRKSQGDYYAEPETSVLHHHKQTEECKNEPEKHEIWLKKEKE
jgi:hypothetical protein